MVPTIMILFANSHNFSWINFSLALNTPLRGMNGNDITLKQDAMIYTILNLPISAGVRLSYIHGMKKYTAVRIRSKIVSIPIYNL